MHVELRETIGAGDVGCSPICIPSVPNVSTGTDRATDKAGRVRTVGAYEQETVARHEVDEPAERQQHGVEIRDRCPRDRTRRC
jgi:hypothetical protein